MDVFQNEICQVYNDDYTKVIGDLKFDYIITDPPYNIDYHYPDYKDKISEEEYINLLRGMKGYKSVVIHYPEGICNYVCPALGRVKKCATWCYNSNVPKQSRSIAWFNCSPDFRKVTQPYKNPEDKRIKERVENGHIGSKLYDWWTDIQLVKNVSKSKAKSFTNQIPQKLLERIIILTTKENDTILDPFFGSGSLYFACKSTNRRCIGIEKSNIHLQSFLERIEQEED
jgi:DNA modification methylase